MTAKSYKIFPLGLDAITIEFGNEISEALNLKVLSLAEYLENNQFKGFIETFPAYASLTVFFEFLTVRKSYPTYPTAFAAVKNFIENCSDKGKRTRQTNFKTNRNPRQFRQRICD